MLLNVLLAVSMLTSTASQLRWLDDAQIGPGEAGLAIWVFLMLTREVARLGPPLTPVLCRLLTFWIIFALAMSFGTMTGYAIGDKHDPVWFFHDIAAYGLVAALSCLMAVEPGAEPRLHRVAWLLASLGAAWLAIQACYGWGLIRIGNFDPWEWDRLRGLCENSNQLALVCAVIGFLSLHLAEASDHPGKTIAALICTLVAVVVGRLTKSDAFLLALIVASSIFIALKFRAWLQLLRRKLTLRSASAWIFVLALPALAIYFVPFASSIVSAVEHDIEEMTRGGTTGGTEATARLRIRLWNRAISRGVESGMLGLGPGPHLDIPASIVEGRYSPNEPLVVAHPKPGIAPNFEAHNTVLDIFVQSGFIGTSALVWLAATALLMTFRARRDALTTLLCGIVVFSAFHLIVRHPLVWFAVAFCLVTAANTQQVSRI